MPVQEWLVHGGAETLDSYGKGAGIDAVPREHVEFIRTWGDVYESDAHFFAHGNYLATRPLDRQPWTDLRWQSLKWHTPGAALLRQDGRPRPHVEQAGPDRQPRPPRLHRHLLPAAATGSPRSTRRPAASGKSNEAGEFRTGELPPIQSLAVVRQ